MTSFLKKNNLRNMQKHMNMKSIHQQALKLQKKMNPMNPELKSIVSELFSKINSSTKDLVKDNAIQPDDLFTDFNMMRNKDKLTLAAFLLNKSYNVNTMKNTKSSMKGGSVPSSIDESVRFSEFANNIYLNQKKFKTFIARENLNLVKYNKKQQYSRVLVPKYAVVVDDKTKSIVVMIKGTSTPKDAIIDGLATTEQVVLDKKNYLAHSGFLRSGKEIVKQIKNDITSLINTNRNYNIVVTGHSLGGGAATVTGVLLHETLKKTHNVKVNVLAYAAGTTFAAEKGKTPLQDYLSKNTNLRMKTYVYKQDIVPRLSLFDGFVFLAICSSICKVIFLNKQVNIFRNFSIDRNIINGMYKELHWDKFIKGANIASSATRYANKKRKSAMNIMKFKRSNKTRKNMMGGAGINTQKVLIKIQEMVKICLAYFENQMKNNNKYYYNKTTLPGVVYQLDDFIKLINPYKLSFMKFKMSALKNHSMANYITALKNLNRKGGKRNTRKHRKHSKKRKTRRRKR